MPVDGICGCEGPENRFACQAGCNISVVSNINIIVVIDKVIVTQRLKGNNGDKSEKQAA